MPKIEGLMLTVLEVLRRTTGFFEGKGMDSPKLQAELILAHGLGLARMDLYLQHDRPLSETELESIRPLVKRRAGREPVQYIEGRANFMGVDFEVDPRVLIPRPETEELIERVGEWLEDKPPGRLVDLGTGSGAIALSLARLFPDAEVLGTDVSADALVVARGNAGAQGLEARVNFLESDWFSALEGSFDLVVSNPPYLTDTELQEAEPEVRDYEPVGALVAGGATGESALVAILEGAFPVLNPGGLLAMETGIAQREILEAQAQKVGYSEYLQEADLSGRDRFFFARKAR